MDHYATRLENLKYGQLYLKCSAKTLDYRAIWTLILKDGLDPRKPGPNQLVPLQQLHFHCRTRREAGKALSIIFGYLKTAEYPFRVAREYPMQVSIKPPGMLRPVGMLVIDPIEYFVYLISDVLQFHNGNRIRDLCFTYFMRIPKSSEILYKLTSSKILLWHAILVVFPSLSKYLPFDAKLYSQIEMVSELSIDFGLVLRGIHACCLAKHHKGIKWLLENGANVNLAMYSVDIDNHLLARFGERPSDYLGTSFLTPLHISILRHDIKGLRLLVRNGADINMPLLSMGFSTPWRNYDGEYEVTISANAPGAAQRQTYFFKHRDVNEIYIYVRKLGETMLNCNGLELFSPEKLVNLIRTGDKEKSCMLSTLSENFRMGNV